MHPFVVPQIPEGQPTTKPSSEDATHFLIRMVHKYPHEVTIYEGGPMTNLALAISLDPQFPELAQELVFMGGSLNPATDNPEFVNNPRHEFNFWFDPEAAHIVLRAAWKGITCTPVDISIKTHLTPAMIHEIETSGTPLARYVTRYFKPGGSLDYMWDELAAAAPGAVRMEDYCHAVEHSIEFQALFLKYLFGPNIRVLPILCGSFARSIYKGGMPEDNEDVRRFFGALGNIAAREGNRLFWVLGIDMAHMGRRYGDQLTALADTGEMQAVAERDRIRIERMNEADADGFWSLVQENHDDLKWCGSSPIYTFLKTVPQARGTLRRYQQWNIDEQSVVSFAAISFR